MTTNNTINLEALAGTTLSGRTATITTTKSGKKVAGKICGNDTVRSILLLTDYASVKEADLAFLKALDNQALEAMQQNLYLDGKGDVVTLETFIEAHTELVASAEKSIDGSNTSNNADAFAPYVLEDGTKLPNTKVYTNTDPKAKGVLGSIHISGLCIHQQVLVAGNPYPPTTRKSRAKTVAKNVLRRQMPSAKWRQFRLDPNGEWTLQVGGVEIAQAA